MATCVSYPKSGRTWLRVMLLDLGINIRFTHLDTGADDNSWGRRLSDLDFPHTEDDKIIFLHRDPRDTVTSFFYEMTRRQRPNLRRTLKYWVQKRLPPKDLSDFVRSERFGIEKVIMFNLRCAENLNGLFIAYEAMREREASGYYRKSYLRPRDRADANSYKVRRGKVGGWRDEMSEDAQEYSNSMLTRYRYFERIEALTARQGMGYMAGLAR